MLINSILFLLLFLSKTSGQSLPRAAVNVLGEHFPGWHLKNDSSVDLDRNGRRVVKRFRVLYKCQLDSNKLTDFAMAIHWKQDSIAMESFLALLSTGKTYSMYILFSHKAPPAPTEGYDENLDLFVGRAGSHVANFGFLDDSLSSLPEEQQDYRETFETDCIEIVPRMGSLCVGYVFENGKFRRFSCGD
jgi:hypothetical protein